MFRPQLSKLAIPRGGRLDRTPTDGNRLLVAVVYDLVAFAVHLGIHRSDLLWSVHKVHH